MKLLTDEHVSPSIANTLRSEGIDAVSIYDTPIVGADDPEVLAFASENESPVLTNDQDYVAEEFVKEIDHWGVFFYEDQRTARNDLVRSVHNALSVLRPEDMRNSIIYVPGEWL